MGKNFMRPAWIVKELRLHNESTYGVAQKRRSNNFLKKKRDR